MCDWTGNQYIGITLDWDYTKQQVHLSMPNYVKMTLKQFQHIAGKLQHAPYSSIPIQYGAKTKKHYATQDLTAPLVGAKTNGSCSKYEASYIPWQSGRKHSTLLDQDHCITIIQINRGHNAMRQTQQLFDYLATQKDAVLSYHVSNMVLVVHSNASYLSKPKASSRANGHFSLSSDTPILPNNGAVLNIVHIIKRMSCPQPLKQNWQVYT